MKVFIAILAFYMLSSGSAYAALSVLPENMRYNQPQKIYVDRVKETKSSQQREEKRDTVSAIGKQLDLYSEIERLRTENRELQKIRNPRPHVIEVPLSVRSLDEIHGTILNSSIVTSGSSEITIFSGASSGPLKNAKFDCTGHVEGQRVKAYCSRIILQDREIEAKILVRDGFDGAASIKPDKIWTGEEEEFLKMGFATFAGALFDSAKGRSRTAIGDTENQDAKNRTLDGLFGVAEQGQRQSQRNLQQIQTVAVLNSGKRVVLQFLEAF
jgi:hypothetical protein